MYKPGDIVFTRGGGFISKAIRFFSRTKGESETLVNHVGIVVTIDNVIVEALHTVKRHTLEEAYGGKEDKVAIFRPINLSDEDIKTITNKAHTYVNRSYGYHAIAAHALDWCINSYFFRRMIRMENYPICSWLVAAAYAEADKNFGIQVGAAKPDDIWDFCVKHKDKYECIRELEKL